MSIVFIQKVKGNAVWKYEKIGRQWDSVTVLKARVKRAFSCFSQKCANASNGDRDASAAPSYDYFANCSRQINTNNSRNELSKEAPVTEPPRGWRAATPGEVRRGTRHLFPHQCNISGPHWRPSYVSKTRSTYACVSKYGGTPPYLSTAPGPALYAATASLTFPW